MLLGEIVMKSDFVGWLLSQLSSRGWTEAELARRAGLAKSTVSRVVSGERQPGNDFIQGVARAFGVPPEEVAVRAGILPDYGDVLPEVKGWSKRLRSLSEDDRAALISMMDRALDVFEKAPVRPRR